MKLRMRHNSIRLRLTRTDVDQLQSAGRVHEVVEFPQTPLVFSIESSSDVESIQASFVNGKLAVIVPLKKTQAWTSNDDVGMEAAFHGLSILIEKDWPCLHLTEAENEDTFARP